MKLRGDPPSDRMRCDHSGFLDAGDLSSSVNVPDGFGFGAPLAGAVGVAAAVPGGLLDGMESAALLDAGAAGEAAGPDTTGTGAEPLP